MQTKFPWGVLLLMGGGFALAKGADESCLSQVQIDSATSYLSSNPLSPGARYQALRLVITPPLFGPCYCLHHQLSLVTGKA